jgi:hypothetical protein
MLIDSECLSILINDYLENKNYFTSLNLPKLICAKDFYGQTGLLVSCLFNNYNSAKLFLENGCNPNSLNKMNESSLLLAVYGKSFSLIKLLVHYNAKITDDIIDVCLDLCSPDIKNDEKHEYREYQKITEYLLKKRGYFNKYNSKRLNKIVKLFPKLFMSKTYSPNIKFKTLKKLYSCYCISGSDNEQTLDQISEYLNINPEGKTKQELCKTIAYKLMISHKDIS